MKKIIQIVLFIGIIVLAYLVYNSIMKRVRFNQEEDSRRQAVIERLEDIRTAQLAYKSVNNQYTKSFDSLIQFLKTDSFIMVKKIGDETDTTRKFELVRDTIKYAVKDSILKGVYHDSLKFIPFSKGSLFKMNADQITKGQVKVSVFEVIAKKEEFLKGLNKNLVANELIKDLRLGSMEEPSTDGNWQ